MSARPASDATLRTPPRVGATSAPDTVALLHGRPLWRRPEAVMLVVFGTLVPLWYALYTGHVWEDYLITFRHSQNLVEGKGLVYNPGERVHGFTSPLGTLLPALLYALTGRSYEQTLWLFRAISIAAYVGGGLLVLRRITRPPASPLVGYAFALFYLADSKAVAFTVDGMETGFMLLFVGWAISLWGSVHPRAWLARGVAWAGLMWTRPDGCIYIGALGVAEWAFCEAARRRSLIRSFATSGLVAAVLYLPWFLFAWSYYGNPIPQTIRAKSALTSDAPGAAGAANQELSARVGSVLYRIYALLPVRAGDTLGPVYPLFWHGPAWLFWFCYPAALGCLVACLVPALGRLGRMASLAFALGAIYLSYVPVLFPWYAPPVALFGLVAAARAIQAVSGLSWRPARVLAFALVGAMVAGEVGLFALHVRLFKLQQAEIEAGQRQQIGLWLHERVRPDDTVFLEPLGYIGYYSGARMRDWPGLVAPGVSDLKHQGYEHGGVIERLRPNWLVLRPNEVLRVWVTAPAFRTDYVPLRLFDVSPRIQEIQRQSGPVAGGDYVSYDATYLVFKRKDSPGEAVPADLEEDARRCREYMNTHILAPNLRAPGRPG